MLHIQRRNFTLNPVSGYICKVSAFLDSFLQYFVTRSILSIFKSLVSLHPSLSGLPLMIKLELTFLHNEIEVNRSLNSSKKEASNVSA